jgi:acyl carrier protein
MTPPVDIRATALAVLGRIAPEADLDRLDPAGSIQDQLDLDSFDFLQFVEGLHAELGVDIVERDYPNVATLDACVAHVEALMAAQPNARREPV